MKNIKNYYDLPPDVRMEARRFTEEKGALEAPPVAFHVLAQPSTDMAFVLAKRVRHLEEALEDVINALEDVIEKEIKI